MTMIRSSLCDFSDAYILELKEHKGTMIVPNTAAQGAAVNNNNKKVLFEIAVSLLVA